MGGGTGQKLREGTTVAAGVASLIATIFSIVSIFLQAKNYRKPLLQRYVIRILLMVPIYSVASWTSMVSTTAASFLDPVRDIYEAFTIYTFFQLLINYLGGERALIIMTHGREPVHHLWPLNHVLPRVDISDPYTFLAIKRGILQYAWLKPVLSLAAIIMKATGTYQEGYIGLSSGYFWSGIVYNISVSVSLYALGLFWVCMHNDLKPFRPVPKFLCVKLIIFASYWQGFFLSILVWLGALPDDVEGYTPDNLAAAIQDALICIEMPIFAAAHWYAFSWHDFADNTVQAARMPIRYAFRDAFGPGDLIQDTKETFSGDKYAYRVFDSGDKVMAHEDSKSRLARIKAGMRYERGGKGKYWVATPGQGSSDADPYTPLLGHNNGGPSRSGSQSQDLDDGDLERMSLNDDEESLYKQARKLEYGDSNYPVIAVNVPAKKRWTPRPSPRHAPDSTGQGTYFPPQARRSPPQAERTETQEDLPVVQPKKKGKQKQKTGAPTTAGRPTSPGGTLRPGVQAENKPNLDDVDFNAKPEEPGTPPPQPSPAAEASGSGGGSGSNEGAEEAQQWRKNDDAAQTRVSPKFDMSQEEFENVWGSADKPGKETHL